MQYIAYLVSIVVKDNSNYLCIWCVHFIYAYDMIQRSVIRCTKSTSYPPQPPKLCILSNALWWQVGNSECHIEANLGYCNEKAKIAWGFLITALA